MTLPSEPMSEALAREMTVFIKMQLAYPIRRLNLTLIVFPRRALVVERTDGRHCWLSVGKKEQLTVGPSGWVNLCCGTLCRTLCDVRPVVFRPSPGALVTCLSCLANGVPLYLQESSASIVV